MDALDLFVVIIVLVMIGGACNDYVRRPSPPELRSAEIREGRIIHLCGVFISIIGYPVFGLSVVIAKDSSMTMVALSILPSLILFYGGTKLKLLGKRLAAPTAEELCPGITAISESESDELSGAITDELNGTLTQTNGLKKRPVIYFRSFSTDVSACKQIYEVGGPGAGAYLNRSEESLMGNAFKQLGPVLAVAKKGEEYKDFGVTRILISSSRWKTSVTKLIRIAAFVVVRIGETPGLVWEIETIQKMVSPTRVFLLVPYGKEQYEQFRKKVEAVFPYGLPEYRPQRGKYGIAGLVHFNSQWKGKFIPLGGTFWNNYYDGELDQCLSMALAPIVRGLGMPYKKPYRVALRIRQLIMIVFLPFFMMVLLGGLGSLLFDIAELFQSSQFNGLGSLLILIAKLFQSSQ